VKTAGAWTSSTIDYIHTNLLERPLFMTDAAGTEVYRWQPVDAFGVGTHNTDVDENGQHRDLRIGFPGQVYDAEVDGWYNYFRDYNARWGRYTQADPIGLAGGVNPYEYAASNALSFIDPEGLDASAVPVRGMGGPLPILLPAPIPGIRDPVSAAIGSAIGDAVSDAIDAYSAIGRIGSAATNAARGHICPSFDRRPYQPNKPGRKKQGREAGEKKRKNKSGWKPRNPPREPPKHTPSRKD